jgi:NADH-quinone oxidoreductase subunit E
MSLPISESENEIEFVISAKVCEEIDEWLKKFPPDRKRSAVVPALLKVQEQNGGWLSVPAMNAVANYLALAPIEVFEVASFYDMYELKPIGRHKISICTNIACLLKGSEELLISAKKQLGIGFGETTQDGLITLRESECLAACGGAPMCQVDDKIYYENLTPEKFSALLDQLQQEK